MGRDGQLDWVLKSRPTLGKKKNKNQEERKTRICPSKCINSLNSLPGPCCRVCSGTGVRMICAFGDWHDGTHDVDSKYKFISLPTTPLDTLLVLLPDNYSLLISRRKAVDVDLIHLKPYRCSSRSKLPPCWLSCLPSNHYISSPMGYTSVSSTGGRHTTSTGNCI